MLTLVGLFNQNGFEVRVVYSCNLLASLEFSQSVGASWRRLLAEFAKNSLSMSSSILIVFPLLCPCRIPSLMSLSYSPSYVLVVFPLLCPYRIPPLMSLSYSPSYVFIIFSLLCPCRIPSLISLSYSLSYILVVFPLFCLYHVFSHLLCLTLFSLFCLILPYFLSYILILPYCRTGFDSDRNVSSFFKIIKK